MTQEQTVADAAQGNWVDTRAPANWRPYLRLMRADRPIGSWLLLLPGWQGIALAASVDGWRWFDAWLVLAFFIGAFVMRGAGCVLNDMVDRDIDAKVERTRNRPLASGQLQMRDAVILLAALCLIGVAILLSFAPYAILVGLAAALPVAIYPFMKRITWWPQLFLGIAFNWGALLGWAAHMGSLDWPPVLLYLGGIAWTIGYDTIYAHQDREDDAMIGVRSTARLFGEQSQRAIAIFYALAVIAAGLAGWMVGLGWLFWLGLTGYALHLAGQVWRLDIDHGPLCLHLFRSNREAGLLLVAALVMGGL
ncbi:MAG: 4-hydroxybenzoate octaprenyltransferase [Neomegalonema sp.]|nr:4-hydroxybenzoate octaprenyltransferase [Neomegalonema sp.]